MIINQMNNRIEFYSVKPTKNEYGEIDNVPTLVAKIWADISKDSVKEYKEHDFDEKGSRHLTFLIDHRASLKIDREMVIKFREHEFNIIDIQRDYTFQDMAKIAAVEVDK